MTRARVGGSKPCCPPLPPCTICCWGCWLSNWSGGNGWRAFTWASRTVLSGSFGCPPRWSMAATVAFLALAFRYLVREGYASSGKALLVVALAAANGRTVILATSMYSEMIYAALSVAGLWLADKYVREKGLWATGIG